MIDMPRRRHWPACALTVLFLAYAMGKAVFATQGRLGFPSGPPVSAAESEAYFMAPSVAQWSAAASGVLGACLVIATITAAGRRIPRAMMLVALVVMLLAVAGGGGIMMLDGFIGVGIGWQWYHGVVGLIAVALSVDVLRSYVTETSRAAA